MNKLKGIHHVTAITSSAEKIYAFFTFILGLRLVKKTINQDDINTYHLFFADDVGSPGTDVTFFDFQGINKHEKGTDEISRIGLRVKSDEAIDYWIKRFDFYKVHYQEKVLFDRKTIFFEDFDGQEYALISDQNIKGVAGGVPWKKGPVPDEYAIIGLGPIFLRIRDIDKIDLVLTSYLGMMSIKKNGNLTLYEMGQGGNGASVIVEESNLSRSWQGYGGVHHVAFRIEDEEELYDWINHLNKIKARHSGFVDRFYFKSLYTRLYPNILFEFATEGPGFIDDQEEYEFLGEKLALPPKFRNKREEIEKIVRPINTVRSNLDIKKEVLS
ncbi:MAG: ring-cleaving dioxygenase [Tenericutes bacterium HGW-Tenericutes-5]|nr:MAG: ring-cleaving dioxygenase [Tenericutes bacterium HGW-Tenericutes-5]